MGKLIDTWTNNQVLLSTDSVYFFFPLNQQINVNICPHWEIRMVLLSRIEIISFENSVCLDKPSNVWTIDGPRKNTFHLTISHGKICDCENVEIWISKVIAVIYSFFFWISRKTGGAYKNGEQLWLSQFPHWEHLHCKLWKGSLWWIHNQQFKIQNFSLSGSHQRKIWQENINLKKVSLSGTT